MSTPYAPVDAVPTLDQALIQHKNPALRLTAAMLQQGFDELRTLYTTVSKYNAVRKDSESLLTGDTDNEVVKAYQDALKRQAEKDAEDNAAYEQQIKQFKDARDAKIAARKEEVQQNFYIPAMQALNLDAGITEDAYTTASAEGKQLAATLQPVLTTLVKQAETSATSDQLEQLKKVVIPKISGSLSHSDAPNFTPKFARVTINGEQLPDNKIKAAEVAKRCNSTRDQFIVAMSAPWAGDTSIWSDADPGFTHSFDVTKNETVYHVTVVKAARTKADTQIDEPANTAPVTGADESTNNEEAPVVGF